MNVESRLTHKLRDVGCELILYLQLRAYRSIFQAWYKEFKSL